jgi:hypothetical protein
MHAGPEQMILTIKIHRGGVAMVHPHVFSRWLDQTVHAFAQLPSRLMLRAEDWRERSSLAHEFDALMAHGELYRTLFEAGLSPSDVPRLLNGHPGAGRQLPEMMRRMGIDPGRLSITSETRDIEWRCTECRTWRRCRNWLASGEDGEGYRAFCPNAAALEALRDLHLPHRVDQPPLAGSGSGILGELEAIKGQAL